MAVDTGPVSGCPPPVRPPRRSSRRRSVRHGIARWTVPDDGRYRWPGAAAVGVVAGLLLASCATEAAAPTSTDPSLATSTTDTVEPGPVDPEHQSGSVDPDHCPTLSIERRFAQVADPTLEEISGAVIGHRSPDVAWVHQDSGHPAVITALDRSDGSTVGAWTVEGPDPVDWEDIALAVDAGGDPWLFVGDIGDNRGVRDHVEIVRVPEPSDPTSGGRIADADRLRLVLPVGPADAEALLVDPRTGDLVVVTKSIDGTAHVLVAPGGAWAADDSRLDLDHVGTLDLGLFRAVLAGDVSPDGRVVVLRTPTSVLWWDRDPRQSLATSLLETEPCLAPSVFDPLGEAIALTADGGYLLLGEARNAPLHRAVPDPAP